MSIRSYRQRRDLGGEVHFWILAGTDFAGYLFSSGASLLLNGFDSAECSCYRLKAPWSLDTFPLPILILQTANPQSLPESRKEHLQYTVSDCRGVGNF